MKNKLLTILIFTCLGSISFAQIFPSAFLEEKPFQDVVVKENSTYFSMTSKLVEISENNQTIILEERSKFEECLSGKFFSNDNGWVYMGWDFFELDIFLPTILYRKYDGQSLTKKAITIPSELFSWDVVGVSYHADDAIYAIIPDKDDISRLIRFNTESEVLENHTIDINSPRAIYPIGEDLNLIVGLNEIQTFSTELVDQFSFTENIIDVEVHPTGYIEVLTETQIFRFDNSLALLNTITLPINDRNPWAVYSNDEYTYLLERDELGSIVSGLALDGSVAFEFEELQNTNYNDLKIFDNKFALWGVGPCSLNSLLKLDINGVDYPLSFTDIALDNISIKYEGMINDTFFDSGDIIIIQKQSFSWEATVSNLGGDTIEEYTIKSSLFDFGEPRFINEAIDEPLAPGESRMHSGEFMFSSANSTQINFNVRVNAGLDIGCENNKIFTSAIVTSTNDPTENLIELYPNPAQQSISVILNEPFTYSIFDQKGALLQRGNNQESKRINLSTLSNGIYFITINTSRLSVQKRFVKI